MYNFIIIYYVIFVLNVFTINSQISDKRLCANADCTEPISEAKTILRYGSPDARILSFAVNENVIIYSKAAGSRSDLWGGEIKGRRGYIPTQNIRETKILFKQKLEHLVDTEDEKLTAEEVPSVVKIEKIELPNPDKVQKPYEVIDGTTIYTGAESGIEGDTDVIIDASNQKETESLKTVNEKEESLKSEAKNEEIESLKAVKAKGEPLKNEAKNEEKDVKKEEKVMENNKASGDDDDLGNEIENKDESVVNNVFSSIKNWINEGNDAIVRNENAENDEDEEEDDDEDEEDEAEVDEEDEEVIDDNEEYEGKVTPEQVGAKKEKQSDKSEQQAKIKENGAKKENEKTIEIPKPKEQVTPFGVTEKETIHNINLTDETKTEQKEKDSAEKEVDQTTKQSNYEVPSTMEVTIDEVTSNPVKTLNINPTPLPESVENLQTQNLQEPEMKILKEENQDVNIKEELHNQTKEQQDKVESSARTEMPNVEVQLTESGQDLNKPQTETEITSSKISTSPTVEISQRQDSNSVIFTGVYPGIFENSNVESPSYNDSNADEADKLKNDSADNNADSNVKVDTANEEAKDNLEIVERAEKIDAEVVPHTLEETVKNENVKETNEEISEAKISQLDTNEPSARNILWGSSIRKEIEEKNGKHQHDFESLISQQPKDEFSCAADPSIHDCTNSVEYEVNTKANEADVISELFKEAVTEEAESVTDSTAITLPLEFPPIAYEVLTVLFIVAITVIIFLWGHTYIERSRQEGPLIAKINNIEKQFLISKKENELLLEKIVELEEDAFEKSESASNEIVQDLKIELLDSQNARIALEEQILNLEKELENSTEVGLELNRMLSNILSSEKGSDMLVANIEQLQRQLIEQQSTINIYNENLSIKETENHELRLELEISNTKVSELQSELNNLALNLLKTEEEKEHAQSNHEAELSSLREHLEKNFNIFKNDNAKLAEELKVVREKYEQTQRDLNIKTNEYTLFKENINQVETIKNNDETLKSLLDMSSIKAELIQLRNDRDILTERLGQERDAKNVLEKQVEISLQDTHTLKAKYDEADREKLEARTKLEILSNYFKDREGQLQKELNKQESMWVEKQGETTSTIERIKYMQEELQNYKAQNESLKQEIVAQEVQMKSQISVLEKKAHENWVAARQAERKLDDAKQEAAQLRNRLTLRERNINDEKPQNRLQSPLEQNGELPVSPLHLTNDTPASPPLLYGARDHLTTSPPLPHGLPPFLPPPPGVPFMPPPLGGGPMPLPPGFLPPPPSMMPGDHRPPPLGRMSSPPLNSRYSPDRVYSPYNRNSPSPTSDDEYGRSSPPPPMYRGYSPYNRGDERCEFNRPPPPPLRGSNRNNKGIAHSSGSANSNESLEKINRHNSKV